MKVTMFVGAAVQSTVQRVEEQYEAPSRVQLRHDAGRLSLSCLRHLSPSLSLFLLSSCTKRVQQWLTQPLRARCTRPT